MHDPIEIGFSEKYMLTDGTARREPQTLSARREPIGSIYNVLCTKLVGPKRSAELAFAVLLCFQALAEFRLGFCEDFQHSLAISSG